jgi:hypothetical protein
MNAQPKNCSITQWLESTLPVTHTSHAPPPPSVRAWRTWGGRLHDDAFPLELLDPLYISHLVTRRRTALGLPPFEPGHDRGGCDGGAPAGHPPRPARRATGGMRGPLLAQTTAALAAAAASGGNSGVPRRDALHETAEDVQQAAASYPRGSAVAALAGEPGGGGRGAGGAADAPGELGTPFASQDAQALGTFSTAGTGRVGGAPGWSHAAAAGRRLQQAAAVRRGAALVCGAAEAEGSGLEAEASYLEGEDVEGGEGEGRDSLSDVLPPPPAAAALATALATDPHTLSMQLLGAARQRCAAGVTAGAPPRPESAGSAGGCPSGTDTGCALGPAGSFTCSTLLRDGMLWLPGEAPVPLNVDFAGEIEPALGRVLGRGGYGVVYEATWRGEKVRPERARGALLLARPGQPRSPPQGSGLRYYGVRPLSACPLQLSLPTRPARAGPRGISLLFSPQILPRWL